MRVPFLVASIAAGAVALYLASCSSNDVTPPAVDAGDEGADVVDAATTPFCTSAALPTVPFSAGPYGTHRGELADAKPGTTATVSYRGLYANATPPDGSGNIDLASYLVISK